METKNENIDKRELIKKIVNKNKQGLTSEELQLQEDAMIKIFEEGLLPGEALGFSEEFLEYVYKYAYGLYQQNKIEEASQLYRWLKTMDPTNTSYTTALTICFIQQKKWGAAVTYLMELAYLNPEDPYPFEKMSECLIKAEDLPEALIAIEKAIQRAGDKKEYATDKAKWVMSYEHILSQLNIDPAIIAKVRAERATYKNLNTTNVGG